MRHLRAVALAASVCACRDSGAAASPVDTRAIALRRVAVGSPAPRFAAARIAPGSSLPDDSVRVGGRSGEVTLLNVWATWCASCREELASLDALQREYGARGLRVVAVSVDSLPGERVARFASDARVSFTVAHDPMDRIQGVYDVVGVPTSYLIARDGTLLWTQVGALPDSARTVVARALSGR